MLPAPEAMQLQDFFFFSVKLTQQFESLIQEIARESQPAVQPSQDLHFLFQNNCEVMDLDIFY